MYVQCILCRDNKGKSDGVINLRRPFTINCWNQHAFGKRHRENVQRYNNMMELRAKEGDLSSLPKQRDLLSFGITKAITNYFTGKLANKFGRKNLLLLGWIFAIPIPFILINATSWNWVIFANILLGINQGLTWSSTVVMKIDLVGEKDRGLAMGINEFAGYFAVGVVAFLTGVIAQKYGVTPYPFYLGIGISIIGLLLTLFFVRDTRKFVNKEQKTHNILH